MDVPQHVNTKVNSDVYGRKEHNSTDFKNQKGNEKAKKVYVLFHLASLAFDFELRVSMNAQLCSTSVSFF